MNDLANRARRRAQSLEPPRLTAGAAAWAAVSAIIAIIVAICTFGAVIVGGGLRAMELGVGIILVTYGSSYLREFARIYMGRLAGKGMHWVRPPSPFVVVSAWGGLALLSWTAAPRWVHQAAAYIHVNVGAIFGAMFVGSFYLGIAGISIAAYVWFRNRSASRTGLQLHVDQQRGRPQGTPNCPIWRLDIGIATGYARTRNDDRGCFGGDSIALTLPDAARGILVAGAPGSGKTSFLRRIAAQCAAADGTALIALSAKADDARAIAAMVPDPIMIGPGHASFSIFGGLSPQSIGACFGAMAGDPRTPFWRAAVANLVSAWMEIIAGLAGETIVVPEQRSEGGAYIPERAWCIGYTPESLAELLYAPDSATGAVLALAARRLPTLSDERSAALSSGLRYFAGEYQATLATARGETLGSVRASVSPYLRALCASSDTWRGGDIDLATAMDRGRTIIVDVDQAQSPQGFEVVSAFVLEHLKRIALTRTGRDPQVNNPCVLLADEFGTYATREHLALFETCRQSNIAAVVSVIGISNLAARIGDAAANAIPSALASILCFATGDQATRKYVSERIGSVRSLEVISGVSSGRHSDAPFVPNNQYSTNEHYVLLPIVDDECWGSLGVRAEEGYSTAVAIVSQSSRVAHDVLMIPAA